MIKEYKEFSQDLRKKFLQIGIIPIIIISAFLFGKIYFIIDDASEKSHTKVLKDIDFYTNELLKRIDQKAKFLQQNFQSINLKEFLQINNDIDTLIIYNKSDGKTV